MTNLINVNGPDRHQDYSIKLLNKEVGDIAALLMNADDSDSIEYLKDK